MKLLTTLASGLLLTSLAMAGDWPQFRGPDGTGVSTDKGLPQTWTTTDNVKWKVETPGRSVACPIVIGKKLIVTSASGPKEERLHTQCFDAATGKLLWHRQLASTGSTVCHPTSSMAAPTACGNADGVYVLFATADLVAYDLDGNLKWYRSLVGDYPGISNSVGMASSPILHEGTLIVPMDTSGDSFIAGVDTTYGKNIWKVSRPKEINWVTPTLLKKGDSAEVVFNTTRETIAYGVADGKKAWSYATGGSEIATPIANDGQLFLPSRGNLYCLNTAGGKVTEVWKSSKLSPSSATPLIYDGRIYSLKSPSVTCGDLKTGKDLWTVRVGKGKGQFWASPIAADGKIFTFDDAGNCTVIKAGGDEGEILAVNEMKEEILGTPAIAHGCMYIRTVKGVYCIAAKP
jgi:outer membrane protein assembly factor BamB